MTEAWREDCDDWLARAIGRWVVNNFRDGDDPESTALALARRANKAWEDWLYYLREYCGSPIEAIIFAYALFSVDGYGEVSWEPFPGQNPPPDFGTVFGVQEQIGRYRVDFLFTSYCDTHVRKLAVECDGHDYHERTKEQAARDRARDRKLTSQGITVMRFTGSEIYKDPAGCVEEIEGMLAQMAEEVAVEAGRLPKRSK